MFVEGDPSTPPLLYMTERGLVSHFLQRIHNTNRRSVVDTQHDGKIRRMIRVA
jgi:hypothetical protein